MPEYQGLTPPDMVHTLRGKTAILVIGAQKSGTSWLHRYLATLDPVISTLFKELHFFDAWLNHTEFRRFDEWYVKLLSDVLREHGVQALKRPIVADALDRVRAINEPQAYLHMFARRVRADHTHLLDTTPSYSVLTDSQLQYIRQFFKNSGLSVKIIFLMRDPIDRYWSALRMHERENKKNGGNFSAKDNFLIMLRERHYHYRTRYDLTIENVMSVFDASEYIFEFYEHLFTEAAVRRLTDFLGIPYRLPDFGKMYNVSPNSFELTETEIDEALKVFAPVYQFCRNEFGPRVPDTWHL